MTTPIRSGTANIKQQLNLLFGIVIGEVAQAALPVAVRYPDDSAL